MNEYFPPGFEDIDDLDPMAEDGWTPEALAELEEQVIEELAQWEL
jgi:hypothetical protein